MDSGGDRSDHLSRYTELPFKNCDQQQAKSAYGYMRC